MRAVLYLFHVLKVSSWTNNETALNTALAISHAHEMLDK